MDGFPTYFTDQRLLVEVIDPRFNCLKEFSRDPTLHARIDCDRLSGTRIAGQLTHSSISLTYLAESELCSNCMQELTQFFNSWKRSTPLSGQALYAVTAGPHLEPKEDNPELRDLTHRVIQRIAAHFHVQTMKIPVDDPFIASWHIAVIPAPLANWLDQNFPSRGPSFLNVAGPVHAGDTAAILECALSLWQPGNSCSMSSLPTAIEVARTICV